MIKYNEPFKVTPLQYQLIMNSYGGICAGRTDENGQCWCKIWAMRRKEIIDKIIYAAS